METRGKQSQDLRRDGGRRGRLALVFAIGVCMALAVSGLASAKKMESIKLAPGLCETTGGGRFVAIPGFPGERIDRRLLTDIRVLERRYSIFITDGYSLDPVHTQNGEHPLGLALDIVPNKAAGGRWSDIDRLARWAEPRQDHPRQPFRWVGYNGDAGHGRGHHLHLSWGHSAVKPGRPARTVYTTRCPTTIVPTPPPPVPDPGPPPAGGTGVDEGWTPGTTSGGIGAKPRLAPAVAESAGVGRDR